jgi:hypothetical protein
MLRRLGFEYRKPKALPRVADEDKQAELIVFYQDFMTKLSDLFGRPRLEKKKQSLGQFYV